jgi:hypothetical protein
MDDLFSTRRPKDFRAGVASGLKSAGKGLVTGVTGLFAAPIIGARDEGFKGCAKGIAVGVAGAVVLPVAGVGVGTAQSAFPGQTDRQTDQLGAAPGDNALPGSLNSFLQCNLTRCRAEN